MLDLIFDFILDPISEYWLVSRSEGSERGREAMDERFRENLRFWDFFVSLFLAWLFWEMKAYVLLVPAVLVCIWSAIQGIRSLLDALPED